MGDHVEVMLRKVMAAIDDQRPRAGRSGVADGQRGRQARRGDQALCDQTHPRQPRRARGQAGDGDHFLHHQSRAYRRHHRQESERARDQEDQAQVPVLAGGRRGTLGVPQADDGLAADRVRRLHVGRRQRGPQAARREGAAAQHRSSPRPSGISTACARAGPRRSRPPRCISTCCATSRRIHSHICSVAYPVLDAAGELPARQHAESDVGEISPASVYPLPR